MCLGVLPVYMCVNFICGVLVQAREGTGSFGPGVRDSCELPALQPVTSRLSLCDSQPLFHLFLPQVPGRGKYRRTKKSLTVGLGCVGYWHHLV